METRVEILKDGTWQKLTLGRNRNIKYNALINRIGKVDSREIGHTNTFSIPSVHNNIKVLGLNIFNPIKLTQALNSKYSAKYYVEDKILQIGFVVINNTTDGNININFIDESLEITEKWGSTTYQELLKDKILPIPQDYKNAIEELETYVLDKTILAPALSEVGTRGYNLALFPNNLNIIGEKFQINIDEVRPDDVFNPYQCRPIFNAKSLFDIGTTAYGYTPIFDDSVDWSVVDRTYIVNSGLNKSAKGDNGIVSVTYSSIASNTPYFNRYDNFLDIWQTKTVFKYRADNAVVPISLDNWVDPPTLMSAPVYTNFGTLIFPPGPWKDKSAYTNFGTLIFPPGPWKDKSANSIFRPNEDSLTVGTLHFTANCAMVVPSGFNNTVIIKGVWKSASASGSPIVQDMNPFGSTVPEITINDGNDPAFSNVDVIVDKALFVNTPAGAGDFVGIIVSVEGSFLPNSSQVNLGTMQVTETYLPAGVIAYDEQGQFLPENIDMTYAAPTKTIKSLLSAIMHKEGILMNIDNYNREVRFFSYGKYYTQRDSGNFYDWSKYLQRYSPFKYNTDYGNNYAVKNRIGLSSPYPGNTSDIILDNQGSNTKYKDFTTNYVKVFKDITNVVKINNTNTPYFEFTHPGLGLVEYVGNLGTLEQQRFDKTSQGNFSGLPEIANVNYAIIPEGVREWYELVDGSIRATVEFLLPTEVIRTLDLSKPVYIEELNGFYIIEEVAEYVDSTTPVNVKLIKLVEDSDAIPEGDAGNGGSSSTGPVTAVITGSDEVQLSFILGLFALFGGQDSTGNIDNYTWSLISQPAGSNVTTSNIPGFETLFGVNGLVADNDINVGDFTVQLTVNNSTHSDTTTFTVTVTQ